ncbi:MAG TPA: SLBB domain-containing protein, partial [Burkholderiaceae bacterium]|nr:SLBB domain-containing protein [Burkholderiaceae bacterium]
VALQPGDIVTVFSQADVKVPIEKQRIFVRVEGEVNVPGVYQMNPSESLQDLIARAGGPTGNAYLFGTEFYREQARNEQQANLDRVLRRLEAQVSSEQSKSLANDIGRNANNVQVAEINRQGQIQAAQETLARLRSIHPTGRIAFGLDPTDRSFNKLPSLKLQNGDRLVVPSKPDFIHIYGAVNQEASVLWRPGTTVGQYLNTAGPTRDADMENIFVLRADGSIVSAQTGGWFYNSISGVEVMPGDSIVLPEKFDKETAWTKFTAGAKDWAQIFSNFGLGAAAIKTLRGL